jgi:hypothetical protein
MLPRRAITFSPCADERTIEALQLRDIRHRAERHQIQQIEQGRLCPVLEIAAPAQFARTSAALRRNATPTRREMPMRRRLVAFVEPVGVDQRIGGGEGARAFVVIDHDHIHTGAFRHFQRLERLRAAIDRDDQARSGFGELHQRRAGRAIALHQPVRDIIARLQPQLAQQADQQRRAGRAIDIIIAINGDRLARLHRVGKAGSRPVHVAEDRRVRHEVGAASVRDAFPLPRARTPRARSSCVTRSSGKMPSSLSPPTKPPRQHHVWPVIERGMRARGSMDMM